MKKLIIPFLTIFLGLTACKTANDVGPDTSATNKNGTLTCNFTFTLLANGVVQFNNTSQGGVEFYWELGNGKRSEEKSPKINYAYNDTYTVKLTAYNNKGDSKEIIKNVTVTNGKTPLIATGEWSVATFTAGGVKAVESYRNHVYEVDITENNQDVIISIESPDLDINFNLYNPLGTPVWDGLDLYQFKRQVFTEIKINNKGKYRIVVAPQDRYAIGKYKLTVKAIGQNLNRVSVNTIKKSDDFGIDGGGGCCSDNNSPRNRHYSFEVTENNTFVDINLSADAYVGFQIIDTYGKTIIPYYFGKNAYSNEKFNKGVYTLIISTLERNVKATFSLEIVGKVQKLTEKIQTTIGQVAQWPGNLAAANNNSYNIYTFDVIEDNSYVDIYVISKNITNYTVLYEVSPVTTKYTSQKDVNSYQLRQLKAGKYALEVYANSKSTESYSLKIVGQVANLKKVL
jgi:PKD repeat protein